MDIFKRGCIGLVFFLMLGRLLWGGVVIDSLTVTNYTGYIIDADRGKLGSGRDAIDLKTTLELSSDKQNTSTYRLAFSLLSSSDKAVALLDGTTVTNTIYITTNLTLSALPVNKSFYTSLVPAQRLNPYITYKPHVTVYKNVSDLYQNITNAGGCLTNYIHFTNTNSSDSAYNVIPMMRSLTPRREYALKTMPSRNAFVFDAVYDLYRYDEYNDAISSDAIAVDFSGTASDQTSGTTCTMTATSSVTAVQMPNHAGVLQTYPAAVRFTNTVYMTPSDDTIITPLHLQDVSSTISYQYQPLSTYSNGNTTTASDIRLLHLEGTLLFGSVTTRVYAITNEPVIAAVLDDYVTTHLNIESYGCAIVDSPLYFIDDESSMLVRVDSNGAATCVSAGEWDIKKAGSPTDSDVWSDVSVVRSNIYIRQDALRAQTVRARLPHGCGYAASGATQVLDAFLTFSNVNLTSTMQPADSTETQVGTYYLSEETKPFRMHCDQVTWMMDEGQFEWFLAPAAVPTYVRKEAVNQLSNNVTAAIASGEWKQGDPFRRSNEMYYRFLKEFTSDRVTVQASTNNGSALTSVSVRFDDEAAFSSAFPYDCDMGWRSGAHITFSNDLISVPDSALYAAQHLTVRTKVSCPGGECPNYDYGITNYVTVSSPSNELFTSDGGIFLGPSPISKGLSWNYISGPDYVHSITSHFKQATFYMPGHFVRGEDALTHAMRLPVAILLAGVLTNTLSDYENPYSESYFDGLGDYAGVNLRLNEDGPMFAKSVIAGEQMGDTYQLSDRCKYYLRLSGVSGLHEAEEGTFPAAAELYGYPMTFTNFSLSYLSGHNKDSRTKGSIAIPYPSSFTQRFDRLTLTCLGDLDDARIPDDAESFTLSYWGSDVMPFTMRFVREGSCSPGTGFLALGVETHAAFIHDDLQGTIGFEANGNLIAPSKGLAGVDSRFPVNNTFDVEGPNDEMYHFYPISTAYLNTYSNAPAERKDAGEGWINVAGTMDVPFYENLEIHFMTDAETNTAAYACMAGGWKADRGWVEDEQTYFTTNCFDKGNNGYPAPYTIDGLLGYQDTNRLYRPAARQKWLDILEFDNALSWNAIQKYFTSFEPAEEQDLLLLKARQQVTYMSPEHLNITFGATVDGSPNLSTESIMGNVRDEAIDMGIGDFFLDITGGESEGAQIRYVSLTNGLAAMDLLVDNDMTLFEVAMEQYVDVLISNVFSDISDAMLVDADYDQLTNLVWSYFNPEAQGGDNLRYILSHMTDRQADATNLVTHMIEATENVIKLIDVMIDGVKFDEHGNPLNTEAVTGLLSSDSGTRYQVYHELEVSGYNAVFYVANKIGGALQGALDSLSDAIDKQITKAVRQNASKLLDAHDVMMDARSEMTNALYMLNYGGSYVTMISDAISEEAVAEICTNSYAKVKLILDPVLLDYESLSDRKRFAIRAAIFGAVNTSETFEEVHNEIIKAYNDNASQNIKDALNTTLQTYEDTINAGLNVLHNSIENNLMPILGKMEKHIEVGNIDGFAEINHDMLDELRMDGDFKFITAGGQNVDTSGTLSYKARRAIDGATCSYNVTDLTHEVKFSARGVPMTMGEGNVIAGMHGKFAFETDPYRPVGLNGGFETYAGYIPVGDMLNIMHVVAEIGFSENEAYVGGQAEAALSLGELWKALHEYIDDQVTTFTYAVTADEDITFKKNQHVTQVTIDGSSDDPFFANYLDFWVDTSGAAPRNTPPGSANYAGRLLFDWQNPAGNLTVDIDTTANPHISNITVYAKSGNTNGETCAYTHAQYVFNDPPMTNGDVVGFTVTGAFNTDASFWWGSASGVMDLLGPAEYVLLMTEELGLLKSKLSGGLYVGKCCDLSVLRRIDEEVAIIVGEAPFTGIYTLVKGHVDVVDWGCWLTLGAGTGVGLFSFADGPIGGIATMDLNGEALCTVSVSGDARLTGALNGLDSALSGSGHIRGKVGWCPFCLKFSGGLRITLGNDRWDIDTDF